MYKSAVVTALVGLLSCVDYSNAADKLNNTDSKSESLIAASINAKVNFIRTRFGWDSTAEKCTIRDYLSSKVPLQWSGNVSSDPENVPKNIIFHYLLIGEDVTNAVQLGLLEFPAGESQLFDRTWRNNGTQDYSNFWTLSAFPTGAIDPNNIKKEENTVDNSTLTPSGSSDATTQGTVYSRWVKLAHSDEIPRICLSFKNACPCVATELQSAQ